MPTRDQQQESPMDGATMVEAALSVLIFFALVLFVIDVGRYFFINVVLSFAAHDAVDYAAKSPGIEQNLQDCPDDEEGCDDFRTTLSSTLERAERRALMVANRAPDSLARLREFAHYGDDSGSPDFDVNCVVDNANFAPIVSVAAFTRPGERVVAVDDPSLTIENRTSNYCNIPGPGETWTQRLADFPLQVAFAVDFNFLTPFVSNVRMRVQQYGYRDSGAARSTPPNLDDLPPPPPDTVEPPEETPPEEITPEDTIPAEEQPNCSCCEHNFIPRFNRCFYASGSATGACTEEWCIANTDSCCEVPTPDPNITPSPTPILTPDCGCCSYAPNAGCAFVNPPPYPCDFDYCAANRSRCCSTPTPGPTNTDTPIPSPTPTGTDTPVPTATITPGGPTFTPTNTPVTVGPSPSPTVDGGDPSPSPTVEPTDTPSSGPSPTPTSSSCLLQGCPPGPGCESGARPENCCTAQQALNCAAIGCECPQDEGPEP